MQNLPVYLEFLSGMRRYRSGHRRNETSIMDSNVLPRKFNQVELWWWDLPGALRWFAGSVSVAAFVGIAGGVLA